MDVPLFSTAVGAALIVLVIADMVVTTVAVSGGAGPLTRRVTKPLWKVALLLHRRATSHRMLRVAGPVLLFTVIAMWLFGLILGWALVFGQEGSLVERGIDGPLPAFGRVYFAAGMVLGRGASVVNPASGVWRFIEQLAGASGVALLSLSLAYVLPVVGAVVRKREVAAYASSLGGSPEEILSRAWDGESFGELGLHFIALTPMVNRLAQDHLAYPILHYFHSGERYTAIGPSIVVLDETLTLLEEAIEPDRRIDHPSIWPLRTAIDAFLRTLTRVDVEPGDEPLTWPVLEGYRTEHRLPMLPDDEVHERLEALEERRCLLTGLLRHDAWTGEEAQSFDPDRFERQAEEQDEPDPAG
jgi:hypothetical protein